MFAPTISNLSWIVLIVLGLLLLFIGRKLVKVLTFLAGGIIGGLLAYQYSLPHFGVPTAYLIGVVGFVIVGLIAYALLYLAAGIAAGALTYFLTKPLFPDILIPIVLAVIAFAVVLILFNKILSVGTAIFGAIIVATGIGRLFPLNPLATLIIVVVLAALGSYVQLRG